MNHALNLRGELVVITGASAGLGAEYARQFAKRGAKLLLVARRKELLENLCDEIRKNYSSEVSYRVVDLTASASEPSYKQFLDELRSSSVMVLVNNAGFGSFGQFEALDIEKEVAMTRLNVEATLRTVHAVLPKMKERRSGAILSIASVAAFQALPYMSTYAGTKSFNLMHSMGLRYEVAEFGIRVVTVCPGPTETEFNGVARVPGTATGSRRDDPVKVVAESIMALDRNSPFVVTGFRSKLMKWGITTLPRGAVTWCVGRAMRQALR